MRQLWPLASLAVLAASAALVSSLHPARAQRAKARAPSTAPASSLDIARYAANGDLALPPDIARWIALGSGVGGNYSDAPFDPANPGFITVVQMEPRAYDYFLGNRRYADGTMLLLSVYRVQSKPDPALQGYVQGGLVQREIHVVDRERFPEEGRAFFVFQPAAEQAARIPLRSRCFECHSQHGDFDGTFTQFYPPLRPFLAQDEPASPR
jgi:hypothetical protein